MFTDNATIKVIAGNGGPGLSSFRRERYVDRGGPDGGDGGDGGDIIAEVKDSIHGLSDYRHIKEIKARNGEQGGPQNRHGRSADDKTIYLPKGTLIYEDGKVIADLVNYGDKFIIAKGGQGGYGNAPTMAAAPMPRAFRAPPVSSSTPASCGWPTRARTGCCISAPPRC